MNNKLVWLIVLIAFVGLVIFISNSNLEMPGADEHVGGIANQYAQEVGAGERDPYINTDKGDLLLFMFALGGAGAGFCLGYNWRDLFGKKSGVRVVR